MRVHDLLEDLGCTPVEAGDRASGLPVLQAALRPGLTVRFITGAAEDAVRNHGLLAPGMAVVTRPFSIEIRATQIRALIAVDPSGRRLTVRVRRWPRPGRRRGRPEPSSPGPGPR